MRPGPDTILVLAGGAADPLARQAGVAHKCLIPIGGKTMIERVIATLRALPQRPKIVVATDRPEILGRLPQEDVRVIAAADSPSRTVLAALARGEVVPPFLLTTADHPLLTTEMIAYFWQQIPNAADVAAAVASARAIRAAWPQAKRTYLRFGREGYSGCNLFALMTPAAKRVAEFWQQAEDRRKRPLALIRLLGPLATLRFVLGTMSLDAAVRYLGRLTASELAALVLPFPDAAVDVDKPEDISLAQEILALREAGRP